VFKEKVGGAKTDRAELAKLLRRIEPGDVLIVPQLLRARRERPRSRTTEQRDELAALHTLPWVSHDQSLIGKHPVTRC